MSVITASVANVQTAGKGVRYAAAIAENVLAHVAEMYPNGYDWSVRGAIPDAIKSACGIDNADAPKVKTGPMGNQTLTDWGRGLESVAAQVRKMLKAGQTPDDKPAVLRVSLSGEGGGTTVVNADHPLYAALVEMITGSETGSADGTIVGLVINTDAA